MITVYSDRIEILSRGTLPPKQTLQGFYLGESVPVNRRLSDIFLQLHISERSGRGVPQITNFYGTDAFEFRENSIVVTIPLSYLSSEEEAVAYDRVGNKVEHGAENGDAVKLDPMRQRIIDEMKKNPKITQKELAEQLDMSTTAVQNHIRAMREKGIVERLGSNRNGQWKVGNKA